MKKRTDEISNYDRHVINANGDYNVKASDGRVYRAVAKILAVLAAFFLWMYVAGNDNLIFEREITAVPVSVDNLSNIPLSLISGGGNQIDVTVKGKRGEVVKLDADDINASVNAGSISNPGRYTLDVNVELPDGVTLVSKNPTSVTVYLDNTTSVTVPVDVKLKEYHLDAGYELGEPVPSLTEISVSGPTAVLQTIKSARVTLPNLEYMESSKTVSGELILVDQNDEVISNQYIKMSTSVVNVTVPVYTTKTVPLAVDYKYGFFNDENAKITITPSEITLKGESSVLDAIDRLNIMTIDEKTVGSDKIVRPITLPDSVYSVSGEENASVQIEHIGTGWKNVVIDNFTVNNPNNLKYELMTQSITVTLRAPENYIPYITSNSVSAVVELDYDNTTVGTVAVPVKFELMEIYDNKVYETGEYTVLVKITP